MTSLEARLQSENPPKVLDSIEVELLAMTLARFTGPYDPTPPIWFVWYASHDREPLEYLRWVDEDGERYYLLDEFIQRAYRS